MDAMALLCTLHADGPSTLKSLRQAGCASLEAIESMEERRLSELLGGPPAAARRFAREARHLRERLGPERLGEGMLDREESVVETLPTSIAQTSTAPTADQGVAPNAPIADDRASDETDGASMLEEALDEWRTLDLEEQESPSESSIEELPPPEPRARPEFEFASEVLTAVRELAEPEPELPARAGTRLLPGTLDGLDPEACLVLAAAGLETIEALAEADALELSESLGLGYGRLWRLACLARRAVAAVETRPLLEAVPAPEVESPASSAKLSPSERPWKPSPSILELEWNREIRPQAPPPGRARPDVITAEPLREAMPEAEGAGGPFV